MRILIYGINYAPELTGIGKYTGEMAEWLSAPGIFGWSGGKNYRLYPVPLFIC